MKGNFQDLINSDTPVLVDFFAEWCGPCKMMAPQLDQLKQRLGEGVRIVKIDVDKNPALANQFNVKGVPTLVIFQHGQPLWRQSGAMNAGQLEQALKQVAH